MWATVSYLDYGVSCFHTFVWQLPAVLYSTAEQLIKDTDWERVCASSSLVCACWYPRHSERCCKHSLPYSSLCASVIDSLQHKKLRERKNCVSKPHALRVRAIARASRWCNCWLAAGSRVVNNTSDNLLLIIYSAPCGQLILRNPTGQFSVVASNGTLFCAHTHSTIINFLSTSCSFYADVFLIGEGICTTVRSLSSCVISTKQNKPKGAHFISIHPPFQPHSTFLA